VRYEGFPPPPPHTRVYSATDGSDCLTFGARFIFQSCTFSEAFLVDIFLLTTRANSVIQAETKLENDGRRYVY